MTTSEAKRYLPKKYKTLSDDQLISLLDRLEQLAEIIIDLAEDGSNKQLGVIDSKSGKGQNGNR